MNFRIPHGLSTLCKKHLHLIFTPSQLRKMQIPNRREEFLTCSSIIHAHQSHDPYTISNNSLRRWCDLLVFWPCPIRQFDKIVFNINKPCFSKILASEYSGVCVCFVESECLEDDFCEAFQGPIVRDAVVVCVDLAIYVLEFYPSTGLHVSGIIRGVLGVEGAGLRIYLLEEGYRRFEDWDHVAKMNEVKVIAVEPFVFDIVHIKSVQVRFENMCICEYDLLDVWRYPCRLYWT